MQSFSFIKPRKDCTRFRTRQLMLRLQARLKYILVHCYARIMISIQKTRTMSTVEYLRYLPDLVLVAALGFGLYTQWYFTEETLVSVITIMGAFVFSISCALQYYFNLENLGRALFHIWVGCLVGILAFMDHKDLQYVTTETVMEALFMASLVLGWFWTVLQYFLKLHSTEARLLTASEGLESLGLILASIITGVDSIALSIYTLAFMFHISAMRLKSFMGLLSFLAFLVVGILLFFPALEVKPNIYALTYFVGKHAFQPVVNFEFCALSMIERWRAFFNKPRLLRYIYLILFFILEMTLAITVGHHSSKHKEWYIVLPLYIVLAVVWLMFHLMFFLTCWKLLGKITECNAGADERRSFNHVMAAKGLRYFALVSQRIIFISLVTTVIVFGVGFETRTPYSLALVFLVLPIEAATLSLFWEIGDNLGGTCTGYAVIAPVTAVNQATRGHLLTSSDVEDISTRGTTTLNHLQQLFTYHMIQNFGCDYSSSGLDFDNLQSKLKAFFGRVTTDGPRFDTYLLYYSGDVYDNGDWALADDKRLTLPNLLEWWKEKNADSGTRLLLVLDSQSSFKWAQACQSIRSSYVGVQTCRYISRSDLEIGDSLKVGSFTRAYVQFNNGQEVDLDWHSRTRQLRALYKVSYSWSQFSFHLPTKEEVENYWRNNFPQTMKPLMKLLNLPSIGSPFFCCYCMARWFRWMQLRWLPPQNLDTGHGFNLINS